MHVLIFSTTSEIFLILRRIQRDATINEHWSSCKIPVILHRFSKNTGTQNFTKVRPVRSEFFHSDGQTNRHAKITVAFRNFANAPTDVSKYFICIQHIVLEKLLFRLCNQKVYSQIAWVTRNFRFGVKGTTDTIRVKPTSLKYLTMDLVPPHMRNFSKSITNTSVRHSKSLRT